MNKAELLKLKEQLEREYDTVEKDFLQYAGTKECSFWDLRYKKQEVDELLSLLLDGYDYDDLNVDVDTGKLFYFQDGYARRKFDMFRTEGGMLNQMILRINHIIGEETAEEAEDYFWADYKWGQEGLERLVEESKKAIEQEKSFIEAMEKGMNYLEEIQKSE